MTLPLLAVLNLFTLNTANTSLVVSAPQEGRLQIVHYGSRISPEETAAFDNAGIRAEDAYPAYGPGGNDPYAVSIVQADGNMTLDLRISDAGLTAWEDGELLTVTSRDAYYPVTVRNYFKSYPDQDMIETWTEIENEGRKPIVATRYYSGCLPIRVGDVWISTLYGSWANEGRICTEPLTRGSKIIRNTDGTRNSQTSHAEAMISLDGKPREETGRVIGAALCWGGNYELEFQTGNSDFHRFFAGICSDNAALPLHPRERFATPGLVYTYSEKGLGGVSRNFHRWGRRYRLAHGDRPRKILLNSWEGIHTDISEPVMAQMMEDAAALGGELFVMDDGWFGGKYSRHIPNSALGDWKSDSSKLPHGIAGLIRKADSCGIRFGIWIEPEMTNTASELYEQHPDWVLRSAHRELVCGRGGTQLVLDLCNPEVQEFVFEAVDGLMRANPGIDYIKWDCNMGMANHGSPYLGEEQSRLQTAYWHGFAKICDRIRAEWPDVTIQLCAAGGGRVNWGVLPWFDEFWTSDNTDALQRIYLQWGASYFFPAIAMGAHISDVPNKATQRTTSLKFRIDVAMSGRLGLELQPKDMDTVAREQCRRAISDYKRIRPIVQFGDLYRLVSPYDDLGVSSLMYVTPEHDEAVFYWYKLANFQDVHLPRVRMRGLDPERCYRITELNRIDTETLPCENRVFSGRFLMDHGLELPYKHKADAAVKGEWSSRVLLLEGQ